MPTENINIETQVQSAITRAALQALVTASTVKKKIYHITDALAGTATIAVYSRSTNQVSYNAMNLNTGKFGMYWLAFDVFNPIVEGDSAVMSYVNNTFFPPTGNYNAVYLDLSTGIAYAWNGTTYFALSGGNVYEPTLGDFPLTGATDTIYIATDTGVMYLWDGSAYVALVNGIVQTVTGYSVDNIDPVNPIVKAIPTAGTDAAEPVTGNIEVMGGVEMFVENSARALILWDDGSVEMTARDLELTTTTALVVNQGTITATSDVANFAGIVYNADYSANFNNLSLINQLVMKSRIWTKGGTPTTTDDVNEGYVVGSLIWDTTNSIMYRCTDNTATAAVWVPSISFYDSIRIGNTVGAGLTRYAAVGFTGLSATVILNLCPPKIHTNFKTVLATAQPATGTLEIKRVFTDYSGTVVHTDTLTIPAGSSTGAYSFTGGTFNAASGYNVRFEIVNNATSTGGFIQGIENEYI